MNLTQLDYKLRKLQRNKIVESTDDLFVVSNLRATINNIEAMYNILESGNADYSYKSTLKEKLKEFEDLFLSLSVTRLDDIGIDIDIIEDERDEFVEKTSNLEEDDDVEEKPTKIEQPVKKVNQPKKTLEPKSLRDILDEVVSASRNYKNRKANVTVDFGVQQGNEFSKPKNADFLKPKQKSFMSAPVQQSVEPINVAPVKPVASAPKQSTLDEPIVNNNVNIGGDSEDFLNLGKKVSSGEDSAGNAGRDFIFNLLKSKGK